MFILQLPPGYPLHAHLDLKGRHALHWACQGGHIEFMATLLEFVEPRELRLDVKDIYGRTPLILAAHGGYVECMKMLIIKVLRILRMCKFYENIFIPKTPSLS